VSENALSRVLGTPPINPVLFVASKVAMVVAWGTAFLDVVGLRVVSSWQAPPALAVLAGGMAAAAIVFFVLASRSLGRALRVGLPTGPTELTTSGVYRFSRHPIYLAVFLLSGAACIICPHPLVIVSALVAVVLHHRIALAEESFLEKRFGQAWLAHKARVPRYAGRPRLPSR
jgi:protein-S-isoprenylcysteine O-methyltransferase Ste14